MTSSNILIKPEIVGPLLSNCYIVWDEHTKHGVIIDPGDDADTILKKVQEIEITIEYILATHGDFDHIGAVAPLKRALKSKFLAHEGDLFFIEDGKKTAHGWGVHIEQPPNPDQYITDGETIHIKDFEINVLHTPGHSPGGVCYLTNNMLFGGDTLFQGSIGRTDFRKGSFDELEKSIKTRLYTLPDNTIVYTGHGPITTIGDEKKYNAYVRE
ncbi:MAG: MBL fold metallo-hydrolase [Candidatus Thermoplasmatota archaeon]|nr:MBL fold metallo-hydrolase [Candidatus Thermoplasmatota archaeon]